eukprot:CAMPEP_0119338054 /NCGR_PEP_ID=MMETSP1333-20130426/95267_1 /TAXON_ID=418940 /ORGANISM="Scyphosphaera apsteinii, Strain RCC1455" /LENGTH=408 /DNA_ID=CAMNT_0007349241 /DNA_START=56 /DNA_END=1279 /DNA_ORIENTATION=+
MSPAGGFGGLYRDWDSHPHESRVNESAMRCMQKLGSALGENWMGCVVDELLAEQEKAIAAGRTDFFPMVKHGLRPLKPLDRFDHSDLFKNLLRNCSCELGNTSTQPLYSRTWQYTPPDVCREHGAGVNESFLYKRGFLPAGDDLPQLAGTMNESKATDVCQREPLCSGFTYYGDRRVDESRMIYFKSDASAVTEADKWHTFKKRRKLTCDGDDPALKPKQLLVDTLRESPPIYIVHDFVSQQDCELMMNKTVPKMGRSVVGGGGFSSWRQSYSHNMVPDFEDPLDPVTLLARRKFAFAREYVGYTGLREGEGQEPINAVYYKYYGDQYRPHCDGECSGGRYWEGQRVATSLVYCQAAEEGGHTVFTRSNIKVVPKVGQMLFFGYLFNESIVGERMDDGHTEHSGCPLK